MTTMTRRSRLLLLILAAIFGAAAIPVSGHAAFEKTIVNPFSGEELGSFTFPQASGPPTAGLEFAIGGFTQAHLVSISWQLDATGGVVALDLEAHRGDDPCQDPQDGPCSASRLLMSPTDLTIGTTTCSAPPGGCSGSANSSEISFVDATPAYSCEGFKGPLAKGPVAIKRKRLSWLRATLRDQDGKRLRRRDLDAAPLLEVTFEPAAEAAPLALPGIGADGTAFVGIGNQWHLLLILKEFADPGNYTVRMVSGDPSAYRIDPTCVGVFVR